MKRNNWNLLKREPHPQEITILIEGEMWTFTLSSRHPKDNYIGYGYRVGRNGSGVGDLWRIICAPEGEWGVMVYKKEHKVDQTKKYIVFQNDPRCIQQ